MSVPLNNGRDPKGPMTPMGQTCDTRLGYQKGSINPDAIQRQGRYGSMGVDPDGDDGRSSGMPPEYSRVGRYGNTGGRDRGE